MRLGLRGRIAADDGRCALRELQFFEERQGESRRLVGDDSPS
jgi:hypothetical protein